MTVQTATADSYNFSGLKTKDPFFGFMRLSIKPATTGRTTPASYNEQRPGQTIALSNKELTNAELYSPLVQDTAPTRLTTEREQLMGEIRSWSLWEANWDGEGAVAPMISCIESAVSFISLLPGDVLPEPMLHASGYTGLFWNDDGLYADIEFLENGRVAYYIEQNGDKHKGAVNFDSRNLPPVFSVLLSS